MTDNVIKFTPKADLDAMKNASRKLNAADSEHYFCMKCDSDQFRLYSGGEVHCAKCGSLMQNLTISGAV